MASHTVHPAIREHGLADGCGRCDELATRPLELDHGNFVSAWERMIDVQFGPATGGAGYRSANEAKLGHLLYTWAVFLERYTPIDPRELPDQLAA